MLPEGDIFFILNYIFNVLRGRFNYKNMFSFNTSLFLLLNAQILCSKTKACLNQVYLSLFTTFFLVFYKKKNKEQDFFLFFRPHKIVKAYFHDLKLSACLLCGCTLAACGTRGRSVSVTQDTVCPDDLWFNADAKRTKTSLMLQGSIWKPSQEGCGIFFSFLEHISAVKNPPFYRHVSKSIWHTCNMPEEISAHLGVISPLWTRTEWDCKTFNVQEE